MNRRSVWSVLAVTLLASHALADGFPGLSLRVSDEAAPAGSIVQIKIDVTEPKPISTGKGKVKTKGLTAIEGIALMNHDQDTFGLALVDGDEISFFIHSPSNLFGTPTDYPIVAIAGRVAPDASLGKTFPLQLDPGALRFVNPAGADYPLEITDGQLTVANSVVIGDVSPGSSVVPAGTTIHISGTNFTPNTRLQLSETTVAATQYISSNRIDVVLGQTTDMHGLRIRARNDDKSNKSESEYFSYERTRSMTPSNDRVLSRTVPLFAPTTFTTATVALPKQATTKKRRAIGRSGTGNPSLVSGFALQNLGTADVSASIELLDSSGQPYAVNTVTIGPDRYLVRELGEVFGLVAAPSFVRVKSTAPLQVLGIVADHSADTATAVPPG
ncbi:MAG TPA: IPT/TIG domain-containing protein [Thermoanaerobaculia bacterium]|jgi:hypothetical protein|nr:IPT/TIG domain-containing protein [Thermoanaerobaculia bacterium]